MSCSYHTIRVCLWECALCEVIQCSAATVPEHKCLSTPSHTHTYTYTHTHTHTHTQTNTHTHICFRYVLDNCDKLLLISYLLMIRSLPQRDTHTHTHTHTEWECLGVGKCRSLCVR